MPREDPHEEELRAPLIVLGVIAACFLLGLLLLVLSALLF